MSPRYAEGTQVSTMASLDEIRKTLIRYGADGFMFGEQDGKAGISFQMRNRRVRFLVTLPRLSDDAIRFTPSKKYTRSQKDQLAEVEKASRQRYRALCLVIKAKLEAIDSGISSFDEEFMSHFVLPNGQTVYESLAPRLDAALEGSTALPLLPGGKA